MGKFFSDNVETALQYIYYDNRLRLHRGQEGFNLLLKASEAGDGDEHDGDDEHVGLRGRGDVDEAREREGHVGQVHDDERRVEREAADHVEDDLQQRALARLGRAGVADHEERADGGDLPARDEPVEVVGRHDDEHAGEEQEHERQELVAAIVRLATLAAGGLVLVVLEVLHVA